MEVIVLEDSSSSDESSEGTIERDSASGTLGDPSNLHQKYAQPAGYVNAVETALAIAAALETTDIETTRSSAGRRGRRRSGTCAPMAPKQQHSRARRRYNDGTGKRPRRTEKNRSTRLDQETNDSRTAQWRQQFTKSRQSTSSSSSSSCEARRDSNLEPAGRCHIVGRIGGKSADQEQTRPSKPSITAKKGALCRHQATSATVERMDPSEVVDLLSCSSSSSDSSVVHGLCSPSTRPLSSFDLLPSKATKKPVTIRRKRSVLNDRDSKRRKPSVIGTLSVESTTSRSHGQLLPSASNDEEVLQTGKRKRVQRPMHEGCDIEAKQPDRALIGRTTKKRDEAITNDQRRKTTGSSPTVANETASHSLLLSSSSSVSASSSPVSLPRPLASRKPVKKPSTSSRLTGRVREEEIGNTGRYRCGKSVAASTIPWSNAGSALPALASEVSVSPLTSLSPSPPLSLRRKRRVLTGFIADRVTIDDLQAQERELAWIRAQRKQTQNGSRSSKPAIKRWRRTHRGDLSGVHGASFSVEPKCGDKKQDASEALPSGAARRLLAAGDHRAMLHTTSYRGVFFTSSPSNILCDQECSAPYDSDCDRPLTYYDDTDTLATRCSILESFGKTRRSFSSVFPDKMAQSQSDVSSSVISLVATHLPTIRRCYQRKVRAILSEARQKINRSHVARRKSRVKGAFSSTDAAEYEGLASHSLIRSLAETRAVKQLNVVKHTRSLSGVGSISFQIGQGDVLVQDQTMSALLDVNYIGESCCLQKYTTSIGVCASYRVEDDPIFHYTTRRQPGAMTSGNDEGGLAKKHELWARHVADDEVAEYVLRLVVGCLGDSEEVFHALKTELNFSHAYTAYSELKKLHDSRQRTRARLDQVGKLCRDEKRAADPGVAAIVKLMEQSRLSWANRTAAFDQRLQPPISSLESNLIDSLVKSESAGMAGLGLRVTDSYDELVNVYCGSFCRMCYTYTCHEHGWDHPLPIRRVDPVYPRVQFVPHLPVPNEASPSLASSDEDVIYLGSKVSGQPRAADFTADRSTRRDESLQRVAELHQSRCDIGSDEDSVSGVKRPQRRRYNTQDDPSEYIDTSLIPLVVAKMRLCLSTRRACGKLCWKNGGVIGNWRAKLSPAEMALIRKLREVTGDNPCVLAAVVGGLASCTELRDLMKQEVDTDEHLAANGAGRVRRHVQNWKQGWTSSGKNYKLLQSTRDQRLQDRGTGNHEYKPCMHQGMCDTAGCSCMKRDHMCEKACACSRDCPNRFEGCTCAPGECRTSNCPCFMALRECDPDVCVACGASELAVRRRPQSTCDNVNVIGGNHKRLGMSFSSVHGYGVYAREAIAANEFVYEYTGAMISQSEAERRGLIYDKMETSYLFDLNEDLVLDAIRSGNKSKFINHEGDTPNCTAKVVSVCGVHHITIWTLSDIAAGEELTFDYRYNQSVGPDWSQRREQLGNTAPIRAES